MTAKPKKTKSDYLKETNNRRKIVLEGMKKDKPIEEIIKSLVSGKYTEQKARTLINRLANKMISGLDEEEKPE